MRYGLIPLGGVAVALLAGCGATNLANLAGYGIARRAEASTWTRSSGPHGEDPGGTPELRPVALAGDGVGHFTLLTYNVAGLPQAIAPSTPRENIPQISPLLNAYDVAVVQEDFSYHRELIQSARHEYRSRPMRPRSFVGDGLSQFSRFGLSALHRVRWQRCNGYVSSATDCLADKGFSFSEVTLSPGVRIHLYNLHADAGGGRLDIETRARNFEQLAAYIERYSRREAVIVAGDTNLRTSEPGDAETLATFLAAVGLTDAGRALAATDDLIDRVMFRPSPELDLSVLRWWQDGRFIDRRGEGLSDHPAIGVEVRWRRVTPAPEELFVAHSGAP